MRFQHGIYLFTLQCFTGALEGCSCLQTAQCHKRFRGYEGVNFCTYIWTLDSKYLNEIYIPDFAYSILTYILMLIPHFTSYCILFYFYLTLPSSAGPSIRTPLPPSNHQISPLVKLAVLASTAHHILSTLAQEITTRHDCIISTQHLRKRSSHIKSKHPRTSTRSPCIFKRIDSHKAEKHQHFLL